MTIEQNDHDTSGMHVEFRLDWVNIDWNKFLGIWDFQSQSDSTCHSQTYAFFIAATYKLLPTFLSPDHWLGNHLTLPLSYKFDQLQNHILFSLTKHCNHGFAKILIKIIKTESVGSFLINLYWLLALRKSSCWTYFWRSSIHWFLFLFFWTLVSVDWQAYKSFNTM
jgi:hypothetical protein